MQIELVDAPPPATSGADLFKEYADTLRENPGRWARYPTTPTRPKPTACRIRTGNATAFGPDFEAVVRDAVIWVRYNPANTEGNPPT